jgi:hypothetical protein
MGLVMLKSGMVGDWNARLFDTGGRIVVVKNQRSTKLTILTHK